MENILRFCRHVVRNDYPGFPQYHEDLVGVAALAVVEKQDIHWRIKDFLRKQRKHEVDTLNAEALSRSDWRTPFAEIEFWDWIKASISWYKSRNQRVLPIEEYLTILKLRAEGYEFREIGDIIRKNHTTVFKKLKRAKAILLRGRA